MTIKLDLYFIGISAGILILLFLALLLILLKTGNRKANKFLSIFLLTIAYDIFGMGILISSQLYYYAPHILLTAVPTLCLLGPSVYLYVQELLNRSKTRGPKKLLHFIPFLLLILYLMPFFIKDAEFKIEFIRNWIEIGKNTGNFLQIYFMYILIYLHTFSYIFLTKKKIRAYHISLKDNFSAIEKRNLNWLKWCLNFAFISLLSILVILVSLYLLSDFRMRYNLIPFVISALGCALAYKAITQPAVIIEEKITNNKKEPINPLKMTRFQGILLDAMENRKLYRKPDLSLGELSAELEISRNYLSYIINSQLNTSFYEFVNKYRLEEVKTLLEKMDSNDNLQYIASTAGFNSKTTFNVIFKKDIGMTPSEYRKKYLERGPALRDNN